MAGPQDGQDEPAAPEGPRTAAPAVNVEARLADKIPEIDLPDVPLGDAIDLLLSMSTLPITVDPDALAAAGVSLRDPVSVRLKETTVGKTLEAVLASRKLGFVAEGGRVLVTSPAEYRETLRPASYTISDIAGGDAKAVADLAGLIQEFVAPESSADSRRTRLAAGRPGLRWPSCRRAPSTIRSSPSARSCAVGQGKPPRSRLAADRFNLATRWDRGKPMLDKEVSVNFSPALAVGGDSAPTQEASRRGDCLSIAASAGRRGARRREGPLEGPGETPLGGAGPTARSRWHWAIASSTPARSR